MRASTTCRDIEIDAPDGVSAIDLERRLMYLAAVEIDRGPDWFIQVHGPVDPEAVEAVVRHWLADIREPTTTMMIDGKEIAVTQKRPHPTAPHRATHADVIA